MDDAERRIGIVGLGPHGTNHAELLAAAGHEVFGVDADESAREAFASRFGVPTHDSLDGLFDEDLAAVVITTPNKFHETAAVRALESGHDVLVEKPLAHSLESAERIADAADRTGNRCAVGFHHRFRDVCQVTKSYLEDGYFGEVTHIDATLVRRRGVPGRGTWYTSEDIAGGGALMDVGAHVLDLLLFFADWPEVTDVMATSRADFGHRPDYTYVQMWGDDDRAKMYDVEDSVTAFCEFDTGTTATIDVAWAANAESAHTYEIRGTEAGGSLDITNAVTELVPANPGRNELELYEARGGRRDHYVNSSVVAPHNDPYRDELAAFVRAVGTGDDDELPTVEEAVRVQRAIDRIYRAARGD